MTGRQFISEYLTQVFRSISGVSNYSSLVPIYLFNIEKYVPLNFEIKQLYWYLLARFWKFRTAERYLKTKESYLGATCSFSCRMLAAFIRRYWASFTRESEMLVAHVRPTKNQSYIIQWWIIRKTIIAVSFFLWPLILSH